MTNKIIAIIQAGQAVTTAHEKYGDFDAWFIKAMDISPNLTKTFHVYKKLEFPALDKLAGIVITGSGAMVTDEEQWSEKTIEWLHQIIDYDIPILGVCYGHQMLAKMLGGQVDWNPKGRQIGQVDVDFTPSAIHDDLFGSLINQSNMHPTFIATHQQSVVKLPKNVTLLASSVLDANHCFRYKNHVWGVQFHPEFNKNIIKEYIQLRYQDLLDEGLNPELICQSLVENQNGNKILQRFKTICFKSH